MKEPSSASANLPPSARWGTFRRLLTFVKPHAPRLAAGLAFGVLFSASNGGFVWVIKGGVKEVFDPTNMSLPVLVGLALVFPAAGIVRGVSDFLATYYIRWVGNRVVVDVRNAMFAHLHELSVGYFSRSRTGELISRTTNDSALLESAVSSVLADVVKQPFTLLIMVVWLFVLDARLALVSFLALPVCVLPIATFGRRVRRYARQAQERIGDLVSILEETVGGVRIVKAFGMEEYENRRFRAQSLAFFSRMMRVTVSRSMVEPIVVLIATLATAVLLLYVRAVRMSVDEFFAFAAALFLLYEPVKKLSGVHLQLQQSCAAADRIFEVLDAPLTVTDRAGALPFAEALDEITFEHVNFSYGDGPVLTDINLTVRTGESLALVGSSGAGKTTLVNLLPRFFDVSEGRILFNRTDLRDMTLKSLRSRIGLVAQETFLFNDTIANNIAYGTPGATREQILDAARRAYAHEFIVAMPDGYESVTGERGVRLSGGQKQRIAIARAILRNPPVLILDEATSALDTESERMVQAAIVDLMRGRTVFAIAHRLSTIARCHRIVVLERGRIVEQGTHEELIGRQGGYRRLYDLQFLTDRSAACS